MTTWIVLLRGVNVGGRNKLPMAALRASLEEAGFEGVRTYVQSGNVVLRSRVRSASKLASEVVGVVHAAHGLEIEALALTAKALGAAEAGNPFPPEPDERAVHLQFLSGAPRAGAVAALAELAAPSESYEVRGQVLYLHAPDGVGRSKFAARAESKLGVTATARNLRSVRKLLELAAQVEGER